MIEKFPKITVILRGYNYSQIRTIAKILVESKENEVKSIEITMNTENALEIIEKIKKEFGTKIKVGAGTVINFEQAERAIEVGVDFILSPVMLDKEILDYCKKKNVMTVPGAFSPTEILKSKIDGADIVKIFPAARLTEQYLSDILAPLDKLPIMVVGGINKNNIKEYFRKGADYAGIASGIFEKEDILNENTEKLKKSLDEFIDSYKN